MNSGLHAAEKVILIILDGKAVVFMKKSDRGFLFDIEMFDLNNKLEAKIKK
jgi:hypothetical protein